MICQDCGVDPEEMSAQMMNGDPCKRGHECHCVSVTDADGNTLRIAWGICCARHVVGVSLMKEEDFHHGYAWAEPSDCICRPAPSDVKLPNI